VGVDDTEVKLEPKAMQVLSCLADNAGEVVPKADLLKMVWNGTFVTEEVLANSIWELRKALGDDARSPSFIQTVPKRGYRLIAPVSENSGPVPAANAADHISGIFKAVVSGETRSPWLKTFAIVLVLVAFGILASYFTGFASGPADIGNLETHQVAVMRFKNHIRNLELGWLSEGVSSMLATGLAETPGLEVVSRQKIQQIVDELGVPDGEAMNPGQTLTVARRAGAGAVLVGSVFEFGSEIRIDAQVEEVTTGKILVAHSVRGSDVFHLIDDLTDRVRGSLDLGDVDVESTPGITDVTTSSLEAYRFYKDGVEARRHLRLEDARDHLTHAVSVDPDFALAYWELKKVAQTMNDHTSIDEYGRRMQENIERLPERKRLMAQAESNHKENPAEANRLLEDLLERYPGEEDAYVTLSHYYLDSYQLEKYMSLLERGVAAIPNSGYIRLYYGYGFLKQARYPEAIRQFEAYASINPTEPNPYDSLGETYLIAGLPERAIEEYGRALEIDPTFCFSNTGRAWAHASLGRYDRALVELESVAPHQTLKGPGSLSLFKAFLLTRTGRYQEAEAEIKRALEIVSDDEAWAARLHLFSALIATERNDPDAAVNEVETALLLLGEDKRHFIVSAHLLGGVARARMGELDAAHDHLNSLKNIVEPEHHSENWWQHLLEGEIALASGDAATAASAFSAGEPEIRSYFNNGNPFGSVFANLSLRDGPARARRVAGDFVGAADFYRHLIRPDISQKWTAVLEPRHVLELARLFEKSGEKEAAREQYRYFLELWKNADEDLPELAEARRLVTS
jgi:DNA-binding winged helix-turn-helix (wHTH) protein/tetratricopeptide (TPR) repeat protein/TolB-like protein